MKRLACLLCLTATPILADDLRVATFNASMNRDAAGALLAAIEAGDDPQLLKVAQIILETSPDLILLNEVDYSPGVAAAFAAAYLPDAGYAHAFDAPSNTGLSTGFDLNGDGEVGTDGFALANDSHGFGTFEGQYGMAVLSRFPINTDDVRTFQTYLWIDLPEARLPVNPDGSSFYPGEALDILRLSSKSHWDIPVQVGDDVLHFLTSHPTPPVFDGPEDRNGLRNAEEIRFWGDYVRGSEFIYDDVGAVGGLGEGALFVVAGDLNSDPNDGDSLPGAMDPLLKNPLVQTGPVPRSAGAVTAAADQGGANADHTGNPAEDTADFNDEGPGNLRVDYVLPSVAMTIRDAGVFWPEPGSPGAELIDASDHRLVWIDLTLPN